MILPMSFIKKNPLTAASRAFARLSNIENNLTKGSHDQLVTRYLEDVTAEVIPIVRKFLQQNYESSGLGQDSNENYTQTGHLKRALANVNVVFYMKRGVLKMNVIMPKNWAPFDNQKGGDPQAFYRAASALNYGYVVGGNLTKRQKKAYKDRNAGKKITKAQRNRLIEVDQNPGEVHEVPPRPFFYLRNDQIIYIKNLVVNYVKSRMIASQK